MDSKLITFLVVGIVAGAAVGTGVGYVLWGTGDNSVPETEYWFFIDFNDKGGDVDEQWVSAKGTDPNNAMGKAFDSKNIAYETNEDGFIVEIAGLKNATDWSYSWMIWGWTAKIADKGLVAWYLISGMPSTMSTYIYFGYTNFEGEDWAPVLDPNSTASKIKWGASGPFA